MIPSHQELVLTVYLRKNENTPAVSAANASDSLRDAITEKTSQRLGGGYESYKVRPETEMKEIHGQPAVSWVADFVRYQLKWSEWLTRVHGARHTMLFFVTAPADKATVAKVAYEDLIATTRIP